MKIVAYHRVSYRGRQNGWDLRHKIVPISNQSFQRTPPL
jgi:hypothetical protein